MNKSKTRLWAGLFVALVFIGFLIWSKSIAQKGDTEQFGNLTSREAALLCTTDMATQYHIHPELKMFVNDADVPIPANVGVLPSCMNSIHTHTGDGIIHVESPVQKDFTLGDFFAVWKKDFSKDKILDAVVDEKSEIVVTVNGEEVDTYENTIFRDKDKIVITYKSLE